MTAFIVPKEVGNEFRFGSPEIKEKAFRCILNFGVFNKCICAHFYLTFSRQIIALLFTKSSSVNF